MKRLVCLLAVLMLTAPTFADVTISVAADGTVTYANPEGQRIRAMALDISVNTGQITGLSGYKTDGYSTSGSPGYGIYMTSIDLSVPASPVWGSPDAATADNPHSAGDIPGAAITVELGSLYDPDVPADGPVEASGTLCVLEVDTTPAVVTIALNTDIGGIILEDNSSAALAGASGGTITLGVYDGPACWEYAQICRGDSDGSSFVDTADWPHFRDSFFKGYGDAAYDPCGDYDMSGFVDTVDWPAFRDNFYTSPTGSCPAPGTWPPL